MSQRKAFPLRLDPDIYDALQVWAGSELRSVNAQIEFLLRRSLEQAGRLKKREGESGPPTNDDEVPGC
jgi:hypothetical protein